jgi:NCS1 family nucleobase:cation symporter-1
MGAAIGAALYLLLADRRKTFKDVSGKAIAVQSTQH